jgi:hypothetical protein
MAESDNDFFLTHDDKEQYNSALKAGDFVRCFVLAAAVAIDHSASSNRRALALAEIAHLTPMEPQLSVGDSDSGVFYIKQALSLDSECIPAAAAAILQYSTDVLDCTRHHDADLFVKSVAIFERESAQVAEPMRRRCHEVIARYRSTLKS